MKRNPVFPKWGAFLKSMKMFRSYSNNYISPSIVGASFEAGFRVLKHTPNYSGQL